MDTVGKNTKAIAEYIKHQLDEDRMGEQMTILGKSNDNPFRHCEIFSVNVGLP